MQDVIKATLSLSVSGCALALVNLQKQLADRTEWIHIQMCHSTIDKAFEEVLRDHSDLCSAVKAQVSVLCQSFK